MYTAEFAVGPAGREPWPDRDVMGIARAQPILRAAALGSMAVAGMSFSTNSVMGLRYSVLSNAVINTAGGPPFPGSVNGTPTTGGQYL